MTRRDIADRLCFDSDTLWGRGGTLGSVGTAAVLFCPFTNKQKEYLFLAVLTLCCCAGFSPVAGCGLLLLLSPGSRVSGLQWLQHVGSGAPLGSRAQAHSCGAQGLADLWHVGSSRTRDETCVSCIGRQILYHWATREAQFCPFLISYFSVFPALLKNDKIVVFLKCTVWYTYTLWEGFHRLVNGHPFLQGMAGAWTP